MPTQIDIFPPLVLISTAALLALGLNATALLVGRLLGGQS